MTEKTRQDRLVTTIIRFLDSYDDRADTFTQALALAQEIIKTDPPKIEADILLPLSYGDAAILNSAGWHMKDRPGPVGPAMHRIHEAVWAEMQPVILRSMDDYISEDEE